MGLVNSFINQIGRELGRDAYRSVAVSSFRLNRQHQIVNSSESIYDQVINFELLTDDEKSFRHLSNLVEKAEYTDPQNFEWQSLFYELDNKIDFCKANLSQNYQVQLEQLDKINATNYKKIKEEHLSYIDTVIAYLKETEVNLSKKNSFFAFLLILIGFRPSYFGEKLIYSIINVLILFLLGIIFSQGLITFLYPETFNGNLPNKTVDDLNAVRAAARLLMGIPLFFYFLYLFFGVNKILKYKKQIRGNTESKIKFENYKAEMMK
ncbi:MAG: DUF485 domain-containing protein [Bacteroidetes bacterium]|nr:DUF485 domain-containing protein [Bacteroidota bacterium]